MSTPRRIDPKTATKRRAARRKRTRETLARIGVLAIVAILVISTIATAIVPATVTAPTSPTATNAVALFPTPTQADGSGMQQILNRADEEAAKGNWSDAASLYRAYLDRNQQDGEAHFKLGEVYLSMQPPRYIDALAELDQAIKINPNAAYAQEAQSLIDQYKDNALTPETIIGTVTSTTTVTGSVAVTGTTVVTGTAPPTTSPAGVTQTP